MAAGQPAPSRVSSAITIIALDGRRHELTGRAALIARWLLTNAADVNAVGNGQLSITWGDGGALKAHLTRYYPALRADPSPASSR